MIVGIQEKKEEEEDAKEVECGKCTVNNLNGDCDCDKCYIMQISFVMSVIR